MVLPSYLAIHLAFDRSTVQHALGHPQLFSNSRPRSLFPEPSLLSSEDSGESGGDRTAPVGIRRLFTGGGDCRRLFVCAKSVASTFDNSSPVSVGVGGTSSTFVIEGVRLCL